MKYNQLGFSNMTQVRGVKRGWARFKAFKVRFNQSLVNRELEALKTERNK